MSALDRPTYRLVFIDNLRWSAISMVVVMHAVVTYSPFGSWYYREHPPLDRFEKVVLAAYQSFQHAVAMGLLFGIAGYFAASAVERKGTARFLAERMRRLGWPLLLYMFLVGPLTEYYLAGSWRTKQPFPRAWLEHVADGQILSGSGPLWFCLVLLGFSFSFALWRALLPARSGAPVATPGAPYVLGYAVAIAAATFAVGAVAPEATTVLNIDVHDFPQYPFMFAAGVMAWRGDWPCSISSGAGARWCGFGLAASVTLWLGLVVAGGALHGNLDAYDGGWHWQAAGMDLWRSFTCVALTIGLITLYRDRCNRQGRWTRFLSRNAFGVYVFHAPILVATTRLLHACPLEVAAKILLAGVLAIALSFLFVGLVARRLPILRAVL